MNFAWFILGLIAFVFLASAHRRVLRYRLVKHLQGEGLDSHDIKEILTAYESEED